MDASQTSGWEKSGNKIKRKNIRKKKLKNWKRKCVAKNQRTWIVEKDMKEVE
jgi:hypothetical protein